MQDLTDFEKLLKAVEMIPGASAPAAVVDLVQKGLRELFGTDPVPEGLLSDDLLKNLEEAVNNRVNKEEEYVKFLNS